jgi:hypothetical protein
MKFCYSHLGRILKNDVAALLIIELFFLFEDQDFYKPETADISLFTEYFTSLFLIFYFLFLSSASYPTKYFLQLLPMLKK